MRKSWARTGLFAALDQAWLSAISFGLSLVFIKYGDKAEFGLYLLLLSPILLCQSVQNALLQSPFATLYPQRDESGKARALGFFLGGNMLLGAIAAVVGFVAIMVYGAAESEASIGLGVAFAAALVGALGREAARQWQYVSLNVSGALLGDLLYGSCIIVGVVALALTEGLGALEVLAVTGVAGLIPFIFNAAGARTLRKGPSASAFEDAAEYWKCGRWGLVGSAITWVNLYAYPYVAAISFGVVATAEIGAARQLMMPIGLAFPVWSNLFRPRIARWFADKRSDLVIRVSLISLAGGAIAFVLLVGIIATGFPAIASLLGPSYGGILPLIFAWAAVFFFSMVRTVLMATLFVDEAGYRFFSRSSFLALLVFACTMPVASRLDAVWIVIGLSIVEMAQTLYIGLEARNRWREWQRG